MTPDIPESVRNYDLFEGVGITVDGQDIGLCLQFGTDAGILGEENPLLSGQLAQSHVVACSFNEREHTAIMCGSMYSHVFEKNGEPGTPMRTHCDPFRAFEAPQPC